MKKIIVCLMFSFMLLAQGALAGNLDTPGIDKELAGMKTRIEQGVSKGNLTKDEGVSLEAKRVALQGEVTAAKADGKVTDQERKDLQAKVKDLSKLIYNEKNPKAPKK